MADNGAGKYEVVCLSIWTTTALEKLGSPGDPTNGLVYNGDILNIRQTGMGGGRLRGLMDNGMWVSLDPRNGVQYTKRLTVPEPTPEVDPPKENPSTGAYEDYTGAQSYPDFSYETINSLLSRENNPALANLSTRLFGSPFQFTKETDIRLEDSTAYGPGKHMSADTQIGRTFGTNILAEAPIVSMIPGKPYYLPSTTKEQKNAIEALMANVSGSDESILEEMRQGLEGDDLSYFDFQSDYNSYMTYVNLLCRTCARFMSVGNEIMPGTTTTVDKYNWKNYKFRNDVLDEVYTDMTDSFWEFVGDAVADTLEGTYRFTEFYVDASISTSESGSSSTQNSAFEQIVQQGSAIGKELTFLSGATNTALIDDLRDLSTNLMNDLGNLDVNNGFVSRLMNTASFVIQGANMNFPEIWGDSSFSKSYSFTVNLVSPYGNRMSIFLNIMVPLMHIIALALPRQMSGNSYTSPFLVKAFTKGRFSTEMAIVDSISIEKGGSATWTKDGLPLEMKVNVSLKDLYSLLQLSVTPWQSFNNLGLTEFLATTCALDLTFSNGLVRYLALFDAFIGSVIDIPSNVVGGIKESITNNLKELLGLFA